MPATLIPRCSCSASLVFSVMNLANRSSSSETCTAVWISLNNASNCSVGKQYERHSLMNAPGFQDLSCSFVSPSFLLVTRLGVENRAIEGMKGIT